MITETWLGLGQAQTTIQLKSKEQHTRTRHQRQRFFFDHYVNLIGTQSNPVPHIQWNNLYPTTDEASDLGTLAAPITTQEVKEAIQQWPNHKSL